MSSIHNLYSQLGNYIWSGSSEFRFLGFYVWFFVGGFFFVWLVFFCFLVFGFGFCLVWFCTPQKGKCCFSPNLRLAMNTMIYSHELRPFIVTDDGYEIQAVFNYLYRKINSSSLRRLNELLAHCRKRLQLLGLPTTHSFL